MKEFDVTITETLKLTVSVEASSKEEAQQMVSDQWLPFFQSRIRLPCHAM